MPTRAEVVDAVSAATGLVLRDCVCLGGWASDVWRCVSDGTQVVAKVRRLLDEAEPHQLEAQQRVLARLAVAGFPTPRLIHFASSCAEVGGRPFSVFDYVEGVTADVALASLSGPARLRVLADFGRVVAQLHDLPLDEPVSWVSDSGGIHPSWAETAHAMREGAMREAHHDGGDELIDLDAYDRQLTAAIDGLGEIRPAICHRDLTLANVVVDGERVAAILDFEMAREWDAAYDMPKLEAWTLAPLNAGTAAFLSGYREQGTLDDNFIQRWWTCDVSGGLAGLITDLVGRGSGLLCGHAAATPAVMEQQLPSVA